MPSPILYSFRRCPYAMRARLALAASGEICAIREVVLRDKPMQLLQASPKGTVPVLVLPDGRVIDESLDIMRWALGRHDPHAWLAGDDAAAIAENDGPFKYHLDRYKYPDRHGTDPVAHRTEALAILSRLEPRLLHANYLCGDRISLADMAIMPFVRQFAATDRAWFDAQPLPHLQAWLSGLTMLPQFEKAMIRLSRWCEGDAPIFLR